MNKLTRLGPAVAALLVAASLAVGQELSRASWSPGITGVKPLAATATGGPAGAACGTITVSQSTAQDITPFNSVSCTSGFPDFIDQANAYLRVFNLQVDYGITEDFDVCQVDFGIESAAAGPNQSGVQPITVNLYTLVGPLNYGNMTLIGTATVDVPDQSSSIFSAPVTATVPAGAILVVEIASPDADPDRTGEPGHKFVIGSNSAGQTGPSYLSAPMCALPQPLNLALIGFPSMHIVMNVIGGPPPSGACCIEGDCSITDGDSCAAQGGVYQGDDSTCDPNPCLLPTGACCATDDTCSIQTEADCTGTGGSYFGDDTACLGDANRDGFDDLCVTPTGACCATDDTCSIQTEADCTGAGGSYFGDDTACLGDANRDGFDDLCVTPTGACCATDDTCSIQTEADCTGAGGSYFGDDTACLGDANRDGFDDLCVTPTGACCATDDTCSIQTEADCIGAGGSYFGDDTACLGDANRDGFDDLCVTPTGACCGTDDTCSIQTEADCIGAGGSYFGDDTACDPSPCIQPVGACCIGTICAIASEADCALLVGVYQGPDTSCSPNPCLLPTGACCIGENCSVINEQACVNQGGAYQGDETSCDPNPCLVPTGACCIDGVCSVTEEANCLDQGGAYQGDETSCDPNPCPLPTGACCIDSACSVTEETNCLGQGGDYQGDDTTCTPNPCVLPGDNCPSCISIGNGTVSGSTLDNTASGVESTCSFNDTIDEWYCYTASCTGTATASTCNAANFDTALAVFDDCPESGGVQIACRDDSSGCGSTTRVSWATIAGQVYYVRVAGFNNAAGTFNLTLSCVAGPVGACCLPNGTCTPIQTATACATAGGFYQGDGTACATVTCPATGACCVAGSCVPLQLEGDCIAQGGDYRGDGVPCSQVVCACPGDGNCFVGNGTPGCDVLECCTTVCLSEPFCCQIVWDATCANLAQNLCGDFSACGPGAGDCFVNNGTPGCETDLCCKRVCVLDPFCCDENWDQVCANRALMVCTDLPTGACCLAGQICVVTDPLDCDLQSGSYQGDDTLCTPNPCLPPTGACCIDGACSVTEEATCLGQGGAYQNDGTTCTPNPCPQVTGACCVGGTCSSTDENSCIAQGGSYQGDGTLCMPNPCIATGACCIGATCVVTASAACNGLSGAYQGDGTTCTPNPCLPPPTGACCVGTTCSVTDATDCSGQGGDYQGDGTTCTPNPCLPPPTGACCIGATCTVTDATDCSGQGGDYQGDGTTCDPDPCLPPTGACCIGTTCTVTDEADCSGQAGSYQGDDATCDPNPCLPPTGACCIGTTCTVTDEADCSGQAGSYQGDDATCDPNPCLPPTGACCIGTTCTVTDEADCSGQAGSYQGDDATCDPNPCLPPTGACCIGTTCTVTDAADCSGQGGDYQGDGATCTPNPCSQAPACGAPGTGDCCQANGTPFCDDFDCCETVCAVDPFCCNSSWDGLCANRAEDFCPVLCPVFGACCFDESCVVLTQEECATQGGLYEGDDTVCEPNPCLPECGDTATGDCCEPNGTPYCNDLACCDAVCAADPLCCSVAWDESCAEAAGDLCPVLCPPRGACCLPDGTCQDDVREPDCTAQFGAFQGESSLCVETICPLPFNDDCENRIPIFDGISFFDSTDATTDGPPHLGCWANEDEQVSQDLWYNYSPGCDGEVTVSLCASSFDTRLAVYLGCDCPVSDDNLIVCNDNFCGLRSQVTFSATAGECYKIRLGGNGPAAGSGVIGIDIDPDQPTKPTLTLDANTRGAYEAGESVNVTLSMSGLCGGVAAASWEAFVEFDTAELQYQSVSYTASPFALHLLTEDPEVQIGPGLLNLAAAIDPEIPQFPTTVDSLLVTITFTALTDGCFPTVTFADDPATRLENAVGGDILPLNLEPLEPSCIGDTNRDGVVDVTDLITVISAWNSSSSCVADFDGDGVVTVVDLVQVIVSWGPCP